MKIFSLIAAASAAKTCKWKTYCTDISATTTVTNSWTCKDCFNVRVQADLNHVADGNWFSNKDSVYVAFDDEVNFIKAAGPVDDVTYWGENDGAHIYQIDFIANHEFGDRRIDSNIEFKRPGLLNIHAWTNICPCGAGPTDVDPCVTEDAPLDDYPSKSCRSKRKGKKLVCAARCNAAGTEKAKPNTVTSCYRESNKPKNVIGEWKFRKNRAGSC
ncbi:Oidioi.mRNA.OKI2018_I69.PAR.g9938.t1.cds [Oikopleura dioica]|uniref:Oidioi.mRNA.OKI2018_I69.PAR.g9938.t1.cds n=1 Tax=Oikopleura dioica TaxID=34765 RepID=A0ABN7RR00_OIKDI|nr:Oidioi.mRNA.OKI2018_I69.PAR.g9938.t1.cds [Oikopleura dioica]